MQCAVSQKTTVLATAVVMPLIVLKAIGQGLVVEAKSIWHMAATTQLLEGGAALLKNGRDLCHMHVFTVVTGTHERQFLRSETKMLGTSALHEGQSLERFQG